MKSPASFIILIRLACIIMAWVFILPAAETLAQAIDRPMSIGNIEVEGNQRIDASTVQTYLGIQPGSTATIAELNNGLKTLYKTGFFADVKLGMRGQNLVVTVVENPSINQVSFEGNSAINDEDLEQETNLKSRSIYTRTAVQTNVSRILDLYRRKGHYSASVDPQIIQREQNRVDLVYEIKEGPVTEIKRITFIGNRFFDQSTLESVIRSSEYRWFQFLSDDDKYDPDRLAYDQELLRRFYRSEGFADFQVKSAFAELTPDRNAFYLTFTIEEGVQYTFGDIKVDSQIASDRRPNLTPSILTMKGDRYNATDVETSIDKMVEALGDQGFAFVEVEPILNRQAGKRVIDLTYQIKEGPRVYVERINIIGNSRTLDSVIRREFRIAEGDPYSTTKLKRSEQRLNNLGYFEKVTINNDQGSAPDKIVINVAVEEKSTGEISLGAGFSSTDGALADVGITERNLLGRGQTLRARVMAAVRRQQYDISFTEPYTFDRELSTGFDIYKITQDFTSQASFDREANGGKLRAGYKLSESLSHNLFYAFEQNKISDIDSDASRFIKDQEGSNITSMIGHSLDYDGRDNRFSPTEGWYASLAQDLAGLGGDDYFLRNEAKSEYYIPVYPQVVLMFAGSAGHIQTLDDDIRINQRFFVGGKDLRGFDDAGIGPRDITTGDSLGGNIYYTASSEIKFPLGLPDDLGVSGALFVDAGSLWQVDDVGAEVVDSNALRASGGFGIAWASPFGPIRIDLARPFIKEDYDVEELFRFSFGTRF